MDKKNRATARGALTEMAVAVAVAAPPALAQDPQPHRRVEIEVAGES